MHLRRSILVLLLAIAWVGEPAFALWNSANEHACCVPKPTATPSCHGMAHHGSPANASLAAGHSHSDCAHDCCTKQRTANNSAVTARVFAIRSAARTEIVVHASAEISANARWSSLSERGPPALS